MKTREDDLIKNPIPKVIPERAENTSEFSLRDFNKKKQDQIPTAAIELSIRACLS
jgi:hypothetical protein